MYLTPALANLSSEPIAEFSEDTDGRNIANATHQQQNRSRDLHGAFAEYNFDSQADSIRPWFPRLNSESEPSRTSALRLWQILLTFSDWLHVGLDVHGNKPASYEIDLDRLRSHRIYE